MFLDIFLTRLGLELSKTLPSVAKQQKTATFVAVFWLTASGSPDTVRHGSEGGDRTHDQGITFVFAFLQRMDYIIHAHRICDDVMRRFEPFIGPTPVWDSLWTFSNIVGAWLLIARFLRFKEVWVSRQFTSFFNPLCSGKLRYAGVHLSVTVRAQQNTFLDFKLDALPGSRHPVRRD